MGKGETEKEDRSMKEKRKGETEKEDKRYGRNNICPCPLICPIDLVIHIVLGLFST